MGKGTFFLFSILSLYVGAGIEQASVNIFICIDAHDKLKSDSFKSSWFILKGIGIKEYVYVYQQADYSCYQVYGFSRPCIQQSTLNTCHHSVILACYTSQLTAVILFYMYGCFACTWICVPLVCLVPIETRNGQYIPSDQSYFLL